MRGLREEKELEFASGSSRSKRLFEPGGVWLKCSFHSHTTYSDGRVSPECVVEQYSRAGYDVVALTDHGWRGYRMPRARASGVNDTLIIGGVEVSAPVAGDPEREYHIVVLGVDDSFSVPDGAPPDVVVGAARSCGALAFVAHPYWSGIADSDIAGLKDLVGAGLIGLEVFNAGCEYEIAKGVSRAHWDNALARRVPFFGLAVDDGHHYTYDFGGGWVMLRAEAPTEAAVLSALELGMFYSSCGPRIVDCCVQGDVIHVVTSPVRSIAFVARYSRGMQIHAQPGRLISEATYMARPGDGYIRVECTDEFGRVAWSNPIWVAEGALAGS